ncbi:hypothetical protein D4R30_00415 [archaeon]|nr:MAG: hypothetical protein D4R30_00415 [archaeon]
MKRNDPKGIRLQTIHKMGEMLKGAGDVSLKRFLATCSYTMGLTRPTAMTYLQDLVDLDLIEIDEAVDLVRAVKTDG